MTNNKYNKESIKEGLKRFFEENERYPTADDIDHCPYLPTSRTIQRKFSGLVALRKEFGLEVENFTKGASRKKIMETVTPRADATERKIHQYLIETFGTPFVHREYMFRDDRRTRTDFFIFCKKGNFSVDVFYPKNIKTMIGCINSKMKTYNDDIMLQYPVIFLQMNDEISRESVDLFLSRKKNKLHSYQKIMNYRQFQDFCKKRTAFKSPIGCKDS